MVSPTPLCWRYHSLYLWHRCFFCLPWVRMYFICVISIKYKDKWYHANKFLYNNSAYERIKMYVTLLELLRLPILPWYPILKPRSLQLIWRFGSHSYIIHLLWETKPHMICSDLTARQRTQNGCPTPCLVWLILQILTDSKERAISVASGWSKDSRWVPKE